ncbi:MAG TPA: methyltransferase domain-containing protein [Solirubrobacterales bacterium]
MLAALGVGSGTEYLDLGCGSGLAGHLASGLGAHVSGLDASPGSIAIAKRRTPFGNWQVGELEDLPFDDGSFDAVSGFNSFQFAANPVNALGEARRVARRGAPVSVAIWGRPEDCQIRAVLSALGEMMPAPHPGAAGPFALSAPGVLEALVAEAGLTPRESADVDCQFVFPDLETALRGLLSPGPAALAIQHSGEERVRDALARALEQFKTPSGGYSLDNKFRYLVTLA